jgi:hypothetical protein
VTNWEKVQLGRKEGGRTDDHGSELEALPDALSMDLVGQVGEADISHKLLANDGGLSQRRGSRGGGDGGTVRDAAGGIAGGAGGVGVRHLRENKEGRAGSGKILLSGREADARKKSGDVAPVWPPWQLP